ncbi:MAG: FHA domain-containing protein [bacterium]|nr:FHA domain-containing protein [bacterium]
MEKFKVCPECGEHNSPNAMECSKCEYELIGVSVYDENKTCDENAEPEPAEPVRICECGFANPASSRKCSECGEDISDIIPKIPDKANAQEQRASGNSAETCGQQAEPCGDCSSKTGKFVLESLDGSFKVELSGDAIVGREAELSGYLKAKSYVSRCHAKFICRDGQVSLINLGSNGTFVNNVRLANGEEKLLSDGDEIGLGGLLKDGSRQEQAAYFIFRNA